MARISHRSGAAKARALVAALGGVFFLSQLVACGGMVVSVDRVKPAEINLSGYKRVAIADAYGRGGDELVADLTQALFETKRFEVLDRAHMQQLMAEHNLSASGAISDDTAVSIGNMIGSAALLIGEVSDYDYREDVDDQRSTCTRYVGSGKNRRSVNYACVKYVRTAKASLRAAFKLLDTTTGKVLAVKSLESTKSDTRQQTDSIPNAFHARDEWLSGCRRDVVKEFMKVIAPYTIKVKVELLDDGDLPELEQGNNFAKIGNWQKAIGHYNQAVTKAGSDPKMDPETKAKAHYNLGIALGYSGRYNDGIAQLETAYGLDPQPRVQKQLDLVKEFKKDDEKLAEQKAGDFDAGAGES